MPQAKIKTEGRLKDDKGEELARIDEGLSCAYDADAEKTFGIRTHRWITVNPEQCQGGSMEGWYAEYKLAL
ncbi:hypothetical protein L4C34_13300 [Vibrio profundum]|uniref:hypothetical protein n=1 Tax=Vibrio profundum TaxID=2910247 RepID=UPI003D1291BC